MKLFIDKYQQEAELFNLNIELVAANKQLEAFSYSISHDLRAPLRAVNGYAEMLKEDYEAKLDEEAKRIISNIKYYTRKMGQLIDDLLSFSRLGRKDLQKTVVNMNELVEKVTREIKKSIVHDVALKVHKLHTVN